MHETRIDTFTLNEKKPRILQEMHTKTTIKNKCCPFLGDCYEEVHSCNLPEYASQCYYRTLKIKNKAVEKISMPEIKEKNIIQKCKRK
jgi:hypothetical protein